MKYYISKPKTSKLDKRIVDGINRIDKCAVFVDLADADICVFQGNWTYSKKCINEYNLARMYHLKIIEGYIYIDKYKAKLN